MSITWKYLLKKTTSFCQIFYEDSYEADVSATYLMLVLAVILALFNINFRSAKTYLNLLIPLPIAVLLPSKIKAKKDAQEFDKKSKSKKESQPLICKGCHQFDFSMIDNLDYCCQLHPTGIQGDTCSDYQSSEAYWQAREIERQERLKNKTPIICRGCKYYHGQEYNQVNLICAIHPQGVEGNECLDYESHTQNT